MPNVNFELAIKILTAQAIFKYQKELETYPIVNSCFIVFTDDRHSYFQIKNELNRLNVEYNITYDHKYYYSPDPKSIPKGVSISDWQNDHVQDEYITIKYAFSLKEPLNIDAIDLSIKEILYLIDKDRLFYNSLCRKPTKLGGKHIEVILEGGDSLDKSFINKVYFHLHPEEKSKYAYVEEDNYFTITQKEKAKKELKNSLFLVGSVLFITFLCVLFLCVLFL
tara:strand:- start:222 stop:890 length:669 start_codon:yes stop_codon:yes gene_type:complete